MATHSSTLAWKIPWMEEPGGLQSMGSLRVGHDFTFTFHFHALEKEMATHSSVLAWRIPGTGEPGGLPSMGSHSRTRLKRLSSSSRAGATLHCSELASQRAGFSCREQTLDMHASVVAACRLSSCSAGLGCSVECGIFLEEGSNPCPLHWQVDSYPLCYHGNPKALVLIIPP